MSAVVVHEPVTLGPLDRLEALCDPGSLHVIRSEVSSRRMGDKARAGDGVVGAAGRVNGRPVFAYAQDTRFAGGSLGEQHAETIVRVLRLAGQARVPVVGFVASAGARMQEGVAALAGYGRIFREHVKLSGVVPQISVIAGTSAGGGSYSPALTDFVVMTRDAAMFLTGPAVVKEVMGEDVDAADARRRQGPRAKRRRPQRRRGRPGRGAPRARPARLPAPARRRGSRPHPPAAPEDGDPGDVVPASSRAVYDVRDVIARVVDRGSLLEIQPRWARNMVCSFARLEGRSVGVIANQPRWIGGVHRRRERAEGARASCAPATPSTCRCWSSSTPPGFMPGTQQEQAGVIRHGAKLLHAFAEGEVPKLTVVLRKAFGGAYITMNSRALGAHLSFAWPGAELGVMGPKQAVGIIHRRALDAAPDREAERDRLADAYAHEHLRAEVAAGDGHVDEIIEPAATRARLAWGLATLGGAARGIHRPNIPL